MKQANTPCPAHTATTRGEVKHAEDHSEAEDPIESGAVNFEARVKTAWKVGSQSKDKYAPRLQPALTNLCLKPLYLSSSNASAHTSGGKFRLSLKMLKDAGTGWGKVEVVSQGLVQFENKSRRRRSAAAVAL